LPISKSKPARRPVRARKRVPSAKTGILSGRAGAKVLETLVASYGEAYETSNRTGRPVSFRVEVAPRRLPKITSVAEETRDAGLENALTAARARGRSRVAEILSGDDMLSADDFAALLGTTRMTVNAKRQNRQVLGLEGATRGFRFPHWQIGTDGKPFSALPILFDRLGNDPWAVYRFLVQHHPELDGLTGRDALWQGKTDDAIAAAESIARDLP
jgi:hypothetical protein